MAEEKPGIPATWRSKKTRREYKTAWWHWWKGEIAICPACDWRPCEPGCPEQLLPAPVREARPRDAAREGAVIGDGRPETLVAAAFAEAARRKELA